MQESEKWKWIRSVVSNPQRPHGLQPSRLLCPWDFPGTSTGVGCHCLLRGMQMTPPLWQKVMRSWRTSWWKWKRRVKGWLKAQHSENKDHSIWSQHFMANRRGNSGWLYFLGLQNHCNHEIKRHLLLEKKVMTDLDSIFKSRDITLPTKVLLVKAIVFPVVMYGCESWTIKKLSTKELMLLNCGVEEDSWESLGLQGDTISPF